MCVHELDGKSKKQANSKKGFQISDKQEVAVFFTSSHDSNFFCQNSMLLFQFFTYLETMYILIQEWGLEDREEGG